jgi:predicted NBD/HSP70 family sugar kinase
LLNKLSEISAISRDQFSAIGMAVPGIISKDRGAVVLSQPLGWQNVPLQEVLEDRWSTDVYVLNNAMAGAMEAYFEGKAGDVRSLLYVLIYLEHVKRPTLISLGCGIVLDGRAYFGEGHTAGEIRVDLEHPLATARNMFGDNAPDSLPGLLRASAEEPELYDAVWRMFAEKIGQVIGRGMDFLSPGCVVIGTDTPELQDLTGKAIQKAVSTRSVSGLLEEVVGSTAPAPARLVFAPLNKDNLARGAIVPRLQELSLVPLLRESVLG